MAQVQDIMELYEQEGMSIRRIAKQLHVSRNTIRRVLDRPRVYLQTEQRKKRCVIRTVLTTPVMQRIDQILRDDQRQPRKQRHTAHRIWERLLEEGFRCGESTIRRYVGAQKRAMKEVFIPLEFGPGEDAQVDWGYCIAEVNGARVQVAYFVAVLSWSRAPFIRLYHSPTQEAFLEGLAGFFESIGGVPGRVWFDRLASAVSNNVFKGVVEQQKFTSFRMYYGFDAQFCSPAKANEKGRVENKIGSLRRQLLVPVPSGKSLLGINQELATRRLRLLAQQVPDGPETVGERLQVERGCLRRLPGERYPCYRVSWTRANRLSLLSVAKNWYSVPAHLRGKQLTVHLYPEMVEIYDDQLLVARHERVFGERRTVCELDHYLDGLLKKPGALRNAKPFRQAQLPAALTRFHERLQAEYPVEANREMIKALLFSREYGLEAVAEAVEAVMRSGVLSSEAVRIEIEHGHPAPPAPDLGRYQVRRRSAAEFNALVSGGVPF